MSSDIRCLYGHGVCMQSQMSSCQGPFTLAIFDAVFVAISTAIFVALALQPAAISVRFERDMAGISMKCDNFGQRFCISVYTSYKQRWCRFCHKFDKFGAITLKSQTNHAEISAVLHARFEVAAQVHQNSQWRLQQKLDQKSPVYNGL